MSLESNIITAAGEEKKVKSPSEIRREKEKEKKKKKKEKEKKETKEKARKKKIADEDKAYNLRMKADREFVKKAFSMGFNLGISIVEHVSGEFKKGELEKQGILADEDDSYDDGEEEKVQSAHALARDLGYEQPVSAEAVPLEPQEDIERNLEERVKEDLRADGMSEGETDKLDLAKAWQAHQIQTLTREITESKREARTYSFEEARKEFGLLRGFWEAALKEVEATTDDARMSEILELTAKEFDDPMPLQSYLDAKKDELSKEEIAFIKCSIEIKKFRAHAKEQLYGKPDTKNEEENLKSSGK